MGSGAGPPPEPPGRPVHPSRRCSVVGVQPSVFSRQLSDGLDGSVLVRLFSGLTRGSVCAETSEDDFHAWCVSAIVTAISAD